MSLGAEQFAHLGQLNWSRKVAKWRGSFRETSQKIALKLNSLACKKKKRKRKGLPETAGYDFPYHKAVRYNAYINNYNAVELAKTVR